MSDLINNGTNDLPSSNLVFYNSETDIKSYLTFDSLDNYQTDIILKLRPSDDKYVTEARLDNYIAKLTDYFQNPTADKTITKPSIMSVDTKNGFLNIKCSAFDSSILLLHVGTEYQIATDDKFNNIVMTKFTHNNNEKTNISLSYSSLTYQNTYFVRVRYGGAGYVSYWSDPVEFIVDKPTINQPILNPITKSDIEYSNTVPYTVSINVSSSTFIGSSTHKSSIWTIYKQNTSGTYDKAWSTTSTTSLTSIRISDLFPSVLDFKTDYFITVKYLGSDDSYSLESIPQKFSIEDISLSTINTLNIFPPIVNIGRPVISFINNLTVKIKNLEYLISLSDIEDISWTLVRDDTNSTVYKLNAVVTSITIPENIVFPNTSYTLNVYYKHKTLGNSEVSIFKFTTTSKFITVDDGLPYPKTVVNNIGYYGEIANNNLMLDSIYYVGEYNSKKQYKQYQEVSKDGKLYICVMDTPLTDYAFSTYFKAYDNVNSKSYYRSGLPSPSWLVNHIGLNPYLSASNVYDTESNVYNKNSGWIKFQNRHNQIIYISKLPIYKNVSIQDLIKADLLHPRRKTIRIGENLYYIRTLVTSLEQGYDSLNYDSRLSGINKDFSINKEPIYYNEHELIEYMLNGDITLLDPSELDMEISEYNELCYTHDKLYSYKADLGVDRYSFTGKKIETYDDRNLVFRPVLELIPEDEYPVYNISKSIPGNNTVEESNYNKYLDTAYLGIVDSSDFVTSEMINIRSGLLSNNYVPNITWFKFYHRGLIYFISYGYNLLNTPYQDLLNYNMVYPTTIYKTFKDLSSFNPGKISYNNRLYNIMLPSVMNYTDFLETILVDNKVVTIETNTNVDTKMSYDSFLSNTIYGLLKTKPKLLEHPGYKGSYPDANYEALIDSMTGTKDSGTFFTMNTTNTAKVICNSQVNINNFVTKYTNASDNVILCLTISAIVDETKLWKKK